MNELILFGAGAAGREVVASLQSRGIVVAAFCDNNKPGTTFEGLPVISLEKAKSTYPEATYVVTIYGRAAKDVRAQLRSSGVKIDLSGSHLSFHTLRPSAEIEKQLFSLLLEPASITELESQLEFRRVMDLDAQPEPSSVAETYFPPFVKWLDDEVFVDCGAADGDTVMAFLFHHKSFKHIYAFEPDKQNFDKLAKLGRECYQYAAGNFDGDVSFSATGDCASHVDIFGRDRIHQVRLDSMAWGDRTPTFIKMDIEGSELAALTGAANTLRDHKPVLAICAYHKAADLWEIPLLIRSLVPEYELRLRRYAEGCRELVWYAAPPERIW